MRVLWVILHREVLEGEGVVEDHEFLGFAGFDGDEPHLLGEFVDLVHL